MDEKFDIICKSCKTNDVRVSLELNKGSDLRCLDIRMITIRLDCNDCGDFEIIGEVTEGVMEGNIH